MRWAITDPRGASAALAGPPSASHPEPGRRLSDWVSKQAPLSRAERLDIYAEAYFSRLAEALAEDFRSLRGVLGETAFAVLVAGYLKEHPSRTTTVAEVGRHLAEYLAGHELGREREALAGLARLEWALIEAFHADDVAEWDAAELKRIPAERWPEARFGLDPSVRLLHERFAVDELWSARAWVELPAESARLLVFRDLTGHVEVRRLDPPCFEVLARLGEGASLGEICDDLAAVGEDVDVMRWFAEWVSLGLIRSVRFA
jgi:hypothetical protein